MADRGDFRGIYTALGDDPDFQDLGPDPQLVWFHLKLKLGPSGIDVLDAAEAVLAERTGIPTARVADAIGILSERGWLKRERNILWLVNALRFEPSRNLGNENHRKAVSSHLASLPKRMIVNDFASAYNLPVPFPDLIPSGYHPDAKPITEDGRRKTEDGRRREAHTHRAREDSPNGHPPPATPLDGEPEPDDLAAWLGEHATVLDDCPPARDPRVRRTLFQQYGPPGMRPGAWMRDDGESVPEAERPRLFAVALDGYAAEGKSKIIANEFAGVVRATVRDASRPVSQGPTAAEEQAQEEARREAAMARARASDAAEEAADKERREAIAAARSWLEAQPDDVKDAAEVRMRAKATARGIRGEPHPMVAQAMLLETVEQLRSESAA